MVFSAALVAAAARAPAELCQRPGQQQRRLRGDEVLRALFLPPARELRRLADFLYAFFCLPLPQYNYYYYYAPLSGRGGSWVARAPPPAAMYGYRRSSLSTSASSSSSSSSSMSSSEHYYYSS